MITIATFEIDGLLRIQSVEPLGFSLGGNFWSFHPISLGIPHEVSDLSSSIRKLTLRARTPVLPSGRLIDRVIQGNGLIGQSVRTNVYEVAAISDLTTANPIAVYIEQILTTSANEVDVVLTLATSTQPLTHWIGS